ncbi:MAG: type II toxin-antitoxin system RelE family toxin [Acidimicrobiales bacterium]
MPLIAGRVALFEPPAGCHGAYRIVYRIEESTHTVHVLDIDHRSEVYHCSQG